MEKIRLELEDWAYNAGLIGLNNILEHNDDENLYLTDKNYIEFSVDIFENFEEKYFDYLSYKCMHQTTYWNMIKNIDFVMEIFNSKEKISEKQIEQINKIFGYVKEKLKKNSYVSVYSYIKDQKIDLLMEKEKLETLKLKKKETIDDIQDKIKEQTGILMTIMKNLRNENYKKYILAKDIIYTYSNEFLSNVAMWHKNNSSKDPYQVFKDYFLNPIENYMKSDKSKYKLKCTCCERPLKSMGDSYNLTWINKMGVDGNKKSSYYWNFNNDTKVCPICNLIFACIPAGITYLNKKGFFINENQSFQKLKEMNNFNNLENVSGIEELEEISYMKIANIVEYRSKTKNSYNEIENIQIIKYDAENTSRGYTFNILSKDKLEIITENKKELEKILYAKISLNKQKPAFNLYQEVMKRIYFNSNLYDLIQNLVTLKAKKSFIEAILKIQYSLIGGRRNMENKEGFKNIHFVVRKSGKTLREKYEKEKLDSKIQSIIYKLLMAVRTKNISTFSEIIIKSYMSINSPVPNFFINALEDEDKLQLFGYSFIMGLTGEEKIPEKKTEGK